MTVILTYCSYIVRLTDISRWAMVAEPQYDTIII